MYLIAFEGLDGSGKSSIIQQLETWLKSQQISFITTREPGGTPLGDKIRDLILEKSSWAPKARAELLLYEASRAQHVDLLIRPALAEKKWVLTDRYSASSLAFQGVARNMGWQTVTQLNDFATDGLKPHLTVLLDLSVEESEKRRSHRQKDSGVQADRIESEARDFHQKVRDGFLRAASEDSKNWLVLDASLSPATLFLDLQKALLDRGWVKP